MVAIAPWANNHSIYIYNYVYTHYTVMVDVTSANQTWLDCFFAFFLRVCSVCHQSFPEPPWISWGWWYPLVVSQLVCDGGYGSIAIEIPAFLGGMNIHKSQLYIDVLTQQGYKVLTQPPNIYIYIFTLWKIKSSTPKTSQIWMENSSSNPDDWQGLCQFIGGYSWLITMYNPTNRS